MSWFALVLIFLAVLVSVPLGVIVLLGSIHMRRLQTYWLAVAASVLAMLPCHPGFIVGLPVGIWALLVLSQPDVKAAFSAAHRAVDDAEVVFNDEKGIVTGDA